MQSSHLRHPSNLVLPARPTPTLRVLPSGLTTQPSEHLVGSAPHFPRTKLQPPRVRRDLLLRPRLHSWLQRALGTARVVLISAPAGAGKTTLLSQIADCRLPIAETPNLQSTIYNLQSLAWLSLDDDDNDLARFLYALVAAFERVCPGCSTTALAALASAAHHEQRVTPVLGRQVLGLLVNDLLDSLPEDSVLALDDLHNLHEPAVYAVIEYLIDNLPPQLTLLLSTRSDPPFSLARLRARRELAELRLTDLRFTLDEAAALLNGQFQLDLSSLQLATLHSQTEGWVAGLGLLAASLESITNDSEREQFLAHLTTSDRYMFEYLADEVLDRQDPFVRMFLLETAVLHDLTPAVCVAVTGRRDAAAILDELYRRNLFLTQLEAGDRLSPAESAAGVAPLSRASYRYHDLFRDFLRERLRREAPEWVKMLHLRAARAETQPTRTMQHLVAAEAWDEAIALIERLAGELTEQGAINTLRGWIAAVPPQLHAERPWLLYWQGVCAWYKFDLQISQELFSRALAGFELKGDVVGQSEALVQISGGVYVGPVSNDMHTLSERALAMPLPLHRRARVLVARAHRQVWHGNWQPAMADIEAALELAEAHPTPRVLAAIASNYRSSFINIPGGIQRTERLLRLLAQQGGCAETPERMDRLRLETLLLVFRGQWEQALNNANYVMQLGERLELTGWARIAVAPLAARIATIRGDTATAERYNSLLHADIDPAGELVYGSFIQLGNLFWYGRLEWLRGNLAAVRHASAQMGRLFDETPLDWIKVVKGILDALLLLSDGNDLAAEALLRELASLQDKLRFTTIYSDVRLLLAALYQRNGRSSEALAEFSPLLARYAEQNAPGALLWEGDMLVPLLRLAADHDMYAGFAERALRILHDLRKPFQPAASPAEVATPPELLSKIADLRRGTTLPPALTAAPSNSAARVLVTGELYVPQTGETLTPRETEVLGLMAAGASNQLIADRLIISIHTVKRHVVNILQKLQVASRTEAAMRARDMGVA